MQKSDVILRGTPRRTSLFIFSVLLFLWIKLSLCFGCWWLDNIAVNFVCNTAESFDCFET